MAKHFTVNGATPTDGSYCKHCNKVTGSGEKRATQGLRLVVTRSLLGQHLPKTQNQAGNQQLKMYLMTTVSSVNRALMAMNHVPHKMKLYLAYSHMPRMSPVC